MTNAAPETPKKPSLLSSLKLTTSYTAPGVKKATTTVPIRKPPNHDFFQVNRDPEFRMDMALLVFGDEKDTFFVAQSLQDELIDHMKPYTLFTWVNRQGVVSLWPVRLPGLDGREHSAWDSARVAVEMATEQWVRIQYNQSLSGYEVFPATQIKAEPQWPDLSFEELIEIASRGKIIDKPDHIVLRKLRGEV